MNIEDIDNQPISTLVADHLICDHCGRVFRDMLANDSSARCPYCKRPHGGGFYFGLPVHGLVDLMQQHDHSTTTAFGFGGGGRKTTQLAVVLFFASLGEVLLSKLLHELMKKQGMSEKDRNKKLSENIGLQRLVKNLFPTAAGVTWKDAVGKVDGQAEVDFVDVEKFYREVYKVRIRILHDGYTFSVPKNMPRRCLREAAGLIDMFVFLHNEYVSGTPGMLRK